MIPAKYRYKEYIVDLTYDEALQLLGKQSQGAGLYRIFRYPHKTIVHHIPRWFLERYS